MNTRPTSWNPGGGAELRVLPISGISDLSPATGGVSLKPGYAWQTIYCTTPGTLSLIDEESDTDNGPVHRLTVQGFAPNDAPTYTAILDALSKERVMVRLREYGSAGSFRQIGSQLAGCTLTYTYATGSDVPDSRGYTLKLVGDFEQAPTLVSPTIIAQNG